MVDALTAAIARLRANVAAVGEVRGAAAPGERPVASPTLPPRPSHKHSMSWIARWRARRKQRR
jgi:hypothetical protein